MIFLTLNAIIIYLLHRVNHGKSIDFFANHLAKNLEHKMSLFDLCGENISMSMKPLTCKSLSKRIALLGLKSAVFSNKLPAIWRAISEQSCRVFA